MSVQASSWVWEHSESTGNARLVLLAIADAADAHGGNSWPTQDTLASMARVSVRTVRRLVADLVELGELEVIEHGGGTAFTRDDRRPHLYRLRKMPGQDGRTAVSPRTPTGGQIVDHGRTKRAPRADTAVLRTSSLNTLQEQPSRGEAADAASPGGSPSTPDHDAEDPMPRKPKTPDAPALFDVEEPERPEPPFSARTVVGAYIASYQATHDGMRPTNGTIGQVSRAARSLVEQGTGEEELLTAARELGKTPYANLDRQVMMARRAHRGPSRVDPTGSPTWQGADAQMADEAARLLAEDPALAAWLAGDEPAVPA